MFLRPLVCFFLLCLIALPVSASDKPKIAVFQCELFDTFGGRDPYTLAEQKRRLTLVTQTIIDDIERRNVYTVVDTSRAHELDSPHARFAAKSLFRECSGCEAEVAAQLGADLSMKCLIHKINNLIINITYYIRDTKTKNLLAQYTAATGGNTDQIWTRSALWLLKNRVFEDPKEKEKRQLRMQGIITDE